MNHLQEALFSQSPLNPEDNQSQNVKEVTMSDWNSATERCLAAGHSVISFLRTPEKFPLRYCF
jgi:hypothetical protein